MANDTLEVALLRAQSAPRMEGPTAFTFLRAAWRSNSTGSGTSVYTRASTLTRKGEITTSTPSIPPDLCGKKSTGSAPSFLSQYAAADFGQVVAVFHASGWQYFLWKPITTREVSASTAPPLGAEHLHVTGTSPSCTKYASTLLTGPEMF